MTAKSLVRTFAGLSLLVGVAAFGRGGGGGTNTSAQTAPLITINSVRQTVETGKSATFSVAASGNPKQIRLVQRPSAAGPAEKAWIKANAIPLATTEPGHGFPDMQPLKKMIGNARVVSLGEATHGTHEFFQFKHRMLEFLVQQMGFTVFAIEANMPEARAVNEYVLHGKGDPAKALAGLYFWTWDTEEVLEMLHWMRRYNEDSRHTQKLKFYGLDMQTATVAYRHVLDFLASVDQEGHAWVEANLAELGHVSGSSKDSTPEQKRTVQAASTELLARFDTRKVAYTKSSSAVAFALARQDARVIAQYAESLAEAGTGNYAVRDRCMAENMQWILDHEEGAKAMLWAHNEHVSASPGGLNRGFPSMGMHLRKALGKDMVIFGFVFRSGGFQAFDGGPENKGVIPFNVAAHQNATMADALSTAGMPLLALDLRRLPAQGPVKDWFNTPQGAFDFGAVFNANTPDDFIINRSVTNEFDALIFVDKTTIARANQSGRRAGSRSRISDLGDSVATNLGFEAGISGQIPPSWIMPPALVEDGFRAETVSSNAKEGRQALHLFHISGNSKNGWASLMQSVNPKPYLAKKIRVSGWIKTDGKPGSEASFWVRVDRSSGRGFFENAKNRAINTTEWTPMTIEGEVEEDAKSLNFGCILWGTGHAWFDDLRLEIIE